MMRLESGKITDKGLRSSHNEDACLIMDNEPVFIVADGVGGNRAGEGASSNSVAAAAAYFSLHSPKKAATEQELGKIMKSCLSTVNDRVLALAEKEPEYRGMASTLNLAVIKDDMAFIANVGDSRAYICRSGALFQITRDHSVINQLVDEKKISPSQASDYLAMTEPSKRHGITRAIGAESTVRGDFYRAKLVAGDILLLCTDGLYNELSEDALIAILEETEKENIQTALEHLIDAANKAGGNDNITAVLVKIEDK